MICITNLNRSNTRDSIGLNGRNASVCSFFAHPAIMSRMTQNISDTSIPSPEQLAELVCRHIPDAQVEVGLYSGNDHFEMTVTSAAFAGKNRVAQHKMVYAALGEHMRQRVHALALSTRTPQTQETA